VLSQVLAVAALVAAVVVAVARPFGVPEAAGAVPAAALVVATGALPAAQALDEVRRLAPTVAFLGAVLVLADLADRAGLFAAAGARLVAVSRGAPVPFLRLVFGVGAAVTAVLSLDATVVLLTPVVLLAAARSRLRPAPHVYACGHLANSASLLLPVSNLTNLVVYRTGGLSFGRFTALMAAPWAVTLALEYAVIRRSFTTDLDAPARALPAGGTEGDVPLPRYPLLVIGLTLAGFATASYAGVDPAVVAALGAAALAVPLLRDRRATPASLVRASSPAFLAFVLGLGVVVRAVADGGLGAAVSRAVPDSTTLPALLVVAGVAAVLANLVNNLPAVLVLLPALAAAGTPALLAGLLGVNLGPNLTYTGSLATLLWRRVVRAGGGPVSHADFVRLGLRTVPLTLVAATVALWAGLRVAGAA
jgi:arsenical pump membrane protein